MVARWRHGAFRVVGLEFFGSARLNPEQLALHLDRLKHLQFVKLPHATREETAQWAERLPPRYAVLHCPSQGR